MIKIRRLLANLVVLAVFAAAVFFVGWIQFLVKPGECAVMESKTSGVYGKPVVPGVFFWRWERLLPTNVTLEKFSLDGCRVFRNVKGELSGTDGFSAIIDDVPDFSYDFTVEVNLKITPEKIHSLYKENKVKNNDDLSEYLDFKASSIVSDAAEAVFESAKGNVLPEKIYSDSELSDLLLKKRRDYDGLTLVSLKVIVDKIPDMEFYSVLKSVYSKYMETLEKQDVSGNKKLGSNAEKRAELLKKVTELIESELDAKEKAEE